ncbi:hypothetical protein VIBNISFn27_550067 [Vibrio nigripulchritudo SFn27]|uniref:Uncharacterized protein n=1 Tax=Vibrio nigripulchritudo TaxID=28173 RepID=U4KHF6_9VIBR|nr:hypothetical protein [Vibrio nigripulchritudo]CCN85491.1 hypothetical protein VIBNIBLFn1_940028 [Vibrio nigripulchritudo BLFn1]CCN89040.1 hypothetical protein VIBNISFn27_550067 [Vibrio nigripulchritudo SFn27]CCN95460.1 hypothetical protein VIBNIENn2_570028 [Vibrio nigripulchritudo ENn2]CCO43217.1 hypothetical protein VIBNISFn135_940029 [Vibrio nigripulchritudo SFn135]CCO54497.1 hypothetical protein VIBNIWn13_70066 [Vibrio nigripulchritudo Wn13]
MIRLKLIQYAEPNYFQGWLYVNDVQLSCFFFASADLLKVDGRYCINFFDHTQDTSQVIELSDVAYDKQTSSVIRKAQRLSPNFNRKQTEGE